MPGATPPVTKVAEMVKIMQKNIASGKWKQGTILPTTKELMVEYGYSVNVVVKARQLLCQMGVLAVTKRAETNWRTGTIVINDKLVIPGRETEGILDREMRLRREYREVLDRLESLRDNDGETILDTLHIITHIKARMRGIGS